MIHVIITLFICGASAFTAGWVAKDMYQTNKKIKKELESNQQNTNKKSIFIVPEKNDVDNDEVTNQEWDWSNGDREWWQ